MFLREFLTEKDFVLILKQCEHQSATKPRDIMGFTAAFVAAKELVTSWPSSTTMLCSSDRLEKFILEWAIMIDPRNNTGYRKVPVSFKNGTTALDPELIPRQMRLLCEAIAEVFSTEFIQSKKGLCLQDMSPIEVYRNFEKIHPFIDGNGRVGHLIWIIYAAFHTGEWPETLPPDLVW